MTRIIRANGANNNDANNSTLLDTSQLTIKYKQAKKIPEFWQQPISVESMVRANPLGMVALIVMLHFHSLPLNHIQNHASQLANQEVNQRVR